MNGKFFDLKKEKQDRMINAALKVFALQGYRHASTDDIVKEARISKGLLFHYFGSKIGLYDFIYDYSVRYMVLELNATVNEDETEFFEVVRQIENAKTQAMRGYPYMQLFLYRSMSEDVSEALLKIEDKRNLLLNTYDGLLNRVDKSFITKSYDFEMISKMMAYTINGLMTERFLDASFQPEMLYQEIQNYIDMIKNMVYENKK